MTNPLSHLTSDIRDGNPYAGETISRGIEYDRFEASTHYINGSVFSHPYRAGSRALVQRVQPMPVISGKEWADFGCGTGISTLELAVQHPTFMITAIDASPGMLELAQHKFHKPFAESSSLGELRNVKDTALKKYLQEFRKESESYHVNVRFMLGDLRNHSFISDESLSGAVAYQFVHWMDKEEGGLLKFFKDLHRMLKPGATLAWSTAAHWLGNYGYDKDVYPRGERWFHDNAFKYHFLDELAKRVPFTANYQPIKPPHTFNSVRDITAQAGLVTEKAGMFYHDYDLGVFMTNHIPGIARDIITKGMTADKPMPEEEQQRIINECLQACVVNPKAMGDTQRKIQFVPMFTTTKQS